MFHPEKPFRCSGTCAEDSQGASTQPSETKTQRLRQQSCSCRAQPSSADRRSFFRESAAERRLVRKFR
jgi:hypothetical protein